MKPEVKKQIEKIPRTPGVYLFYDENGKVVYVGKASVLKTRVGSYFQKRSTKEIRPIQEKIDNVKRIDAVKTDTVIEALLLEAELIKKYWPKYNVLGKDGRSFLYVGITRDDFPKVLLIRKKELNNGKYDEKKDFVALFGPYTSATSIRTTLKIIRKIFGFSTCEPVVSIKKSAKKSLNKNEVKNGRACFYRGIGLCPGVCTGEISKREYRKIIKNIIKFFKGKKKEIIRDLKSEMKKASKETDFEKAEILLNQINALEHIQDVAVIKSDKTRVGEAQTDIDIFGRIEGYDVSNISGEFAVGAMVVFVNGEPEKSEYRKFTIKSVEGANDVAMMEEIISRRFARSDWESPELILIDGGLPQVNRAKRIMVEMELNIPIIGIAKGAKRKKNQFIIPKQKKKIVEELGQISRLYPHILIGLRDEAHRFAQGFYRKKHRASIVDKS